ncbi:metal-sensitive transcriptional regulator [Frankia sp. EI5c]|uniref:metal-sensitive transcriptional regulator n=1 Tax=Frankia sp. EI5c TaxID=683316 RepID=UPI000A07245C|nr:metal-sensitive transcriptional regulator [Frankia sp. EI5c]
MRVKAEADGTAQGQGQGQEPSQHSQPQRSESQHSESQHGYSPAKDEYTARLRRIEGQVRGLQRMVAEDKYCIDILTQVSAATRALQSVALGLLNDHLAHCVAQAVAEGGPAADEKLREATAAIARLVRS